MFPATNIPDYKLNFYKPELGIKPAQDMQKMQNKSLGFS